MPPLVSVSELTVEYPGLRALDAVSFALEARSITALVGPNGAGKTTLMRCLCALDRPLAGRIELAGLDVLEAPREAHERLGFLPDFIGLYDELTVAQCLQYAAAANGVHGQLATRVADTATRLALDTRLGQRVGELSRGLRQRVAIGQAIIHRPEILVLDEPASGLDPEARHELAGLFRELQQQGMTLLVSSHILAELADYATHMLVLRGGRVIEHRALTAAPAHVLLALEVEGAAAPVRDWLATRPDVSAVVQDGDEIRCVLHGDRLAQAALLRALVESGAAPVRFGPVGADLQQSYLDTLRAARSSA